MARLEVAQDRLAAFPVALPQRADDKRHAVTAEAFAEQARHDAGAGVHRASAAVGVQRPQRRRKGCQRLVESGPLADAQHLWLHREPLRARRTCKLRAAPHVRSWRGGQDGSQASRRALPLAHRSALSMLRTCSLACRTRSASPACCAGQYWLTLTLNTDSVCSCTLPMSVVCGEELGVKGWGSKAGG